jgi:hypothetical protein
MIAAQKELRRIAKDQGEAAVKELVAPLFEFPVEAVRWTQYTPYFNDGDPCEFGVHEPYVKITGLDDEGDYGDGFIDSWSLTYRLAPFPEGGYRNRSAAEIDKYRRQHEERRQEALQNLPEGFTADSMQTFADAMTEVSKTLQAATDFMEAAFGDHVQITVTRNGIEVDEYSHD